MQKDNDIGNQIAKKLDTLISLFKLANYSQIEDIMSKIRKDKVYVKILEILHDPVSYSQLSSMVAQTLGVAEITVKKKVSELYDMGLLIKERRGKEVYYVISDIVGG
jgi:DNA-binding transcriptional ArsR family regulator